MSKGKNRGTGYNRPSGGYQRNMQKHYMNQEGIQQPKSLDPKKFKITAICFGVVWVVACILLQGFVGWVGLLCAVLVGLAVVVGVFLYLRSKQREVIRFYKKMGMTEAMYINEMKRRNVDPKQLEAYRKAWQKTKVE
jgi:hypothetical protein